MLARTASSTRVDPSDAEQIGRGYILNGAQIPIENHPGKPFVVRQVCIMSVAAADASSNVAISWVVDFGRFSPGSRPAARPSMNMTKAHEPLTIVADDC